MLQGSDYVLCEPFEVICVPRRSLYVLDVRKNILQSRDVILVVTGMLNTSGRSLKCFFCIYFWLIWYVLFEYNINKSCVECNRENMSLNTRVIDNTPRNKSTFKYGCIAQI